MMMFYQHIIFIFILVALQGISFSHARPVNKVTVVTTKKVSGMEEVGSFSLQKEIVPNVANFESSVRIGVRKMSNSKKDSMASSETVVGKRKDGEGFKWKDSFKAFSADYRSPKPHPPKNN